jgi:hypothetical protein
MSLLLRDRAPEELAFEIRRLFGVDPQRQPAAPRGPFSISVCRYQSNFPGAITPAPGYPIPLSIASTAAQPYGRKSAVDGPLFTVPFDDVDYGPGTVPTVPVNKGPKPRHPALEECYEHCFQDWLFNTAKICRPLWGHSTARKVAYAKCMAKEGEKQGSCIADCNRAANRAPRDDGY